MKVFNYAGTDKDDDAQLKLGLAYQSMGSIEKAKEEFQRLIDYFPGSEYLCVCSGGTTSSCAKENLITLDLRKNYKNIC